MLEEVTTGIIANLLTKIGVDVAKQVLIASSPSKEDKGLSLPPMDSELIGEPPRFLARQRCHHRIRLARAKWDWLILATHYHPIRGRTQELPEEWDPRRIGGHFTTADFASSKLPHEDDIGATAPTEIRVALIHRTISIANELAENIRTLEYSLSKTLASHRFPPPLWSCTGIELPWACSFLETSGAEFDGLPQLNSYCGFKNLWSVQDTPASGVQARGRATPNIFAYCAVMELAWILMQHDPEMGMVYSRNFDKHQLPHQYALRRLASHILKNIWRERSGTLTKDHRGRGGCT